MTRDTLTFRYLLGKLDTLRIECPKCGRAGQYRIENLLAQYGDAISLPDWRALVTADCPRRQRKEYGDQCGAIMPDLVKL